MLGAKTNLVLIGFMGCGKTEIGRRVADRLGRPFADTDAMIEEAGVPIADIFAAEGENGFRRREREALAAAAKLTGAVIATGGGAILDPDNVATLSKNGILVWLNVNAEETLHRLEGDTSRPLLQSEDYVDVPGEDNAVVARRRRRITRLLAEREPLYREASDVIVECSEIGPDEATDEICRRLTRSARSRHRTIGVDLGDGYTIHVGNGLLSKVHSLAGLERRARIAVVSHPRINRLWGEQLIGGLKTSGHDVVEVLFGEGESRKTLDTFSRVSRRLAKQKFSRDDVVIAFGGGVVGDVAGYAAASYARGIDVIQVPTTLLAMVDSAIGGKTGVNLAEGKNLVGAFHQPRAVIADVNVLETLPERELSGGMAECVKYALIAEPEMGERLGPAMSDRAALTEIIVESASVKAGIVSRDERESGLRAVLNYGHTLAHAIEAMHLSGRLDWHRASIHHGEAVAMGMMFAAHLSVRLKLASDDLIDTHLKLLDSVGLPCRVPPVSFTDLKRYMGVDKKRRLDGLKFVLLTEPGRPVLIGEVSEKDQAAAFAEICE